MWWRRSALCLWGIGRSSPGGRAPFCNNLRRPHVVSVVDFVECAALGFKPKHPEPDHAKDIPRGEVTQCRAKHDEVGCGWPGHVARAHDQRQAEWPDELAAVADAIAETHAAGSEPSRPDLRHIRPDDGVNGAAEKALRHHQDE